MVSKLQERRSAVLLRIGKDGFTRGALAGVDCFNFIAAANLSAILNKELQVKDTRDVFDRIPPAALALPHLGAFAIAVLGAAFEVKRIGGDAPLVAWIRRHAGAKDAKVHTFVSLKQHEAKDRAEERKADRANRETRRAKAHRLRRDRFLARTGAK